MTDQEQGNSKSSSHSEDEYDLAEDAYDDEGTLDEEELLPDENNDDELKQLKDDANLSIDELRRRYAANPNDESETSDDSQSPSNSEQQQYSDAQEGSHIDSGDSAGPSGDVKIGEASLGYFADVDENEEDADYMPPDPWRRNVRIGSLYQVDVPDTIEPEPDCSVDGVNEERESLLWRPCSSTEMVEDFLLSYKEKELEATGQKVTEKDREATLKMKSVIPIRDNENALKSYLDAKYDAGSAISQYPPEPANPPKVTIGINRPKWTDEECDLFESGLESHGKNFPAIQRIINESKGKREVDSNRKSDGKIEKTVEIEDGSSLSKQDSVRTIGEVVEFYYAWKKSERRSIFEKRIIEKNRTVEVAGEDWMLSDSPDLMDSIIDGIETAAAEQGFTRPPNIRQRSFAEMTQSGFPSFRIEASTSETLPHLDNDTLANVLQ